MTTNKFNLHLRLGRSAPYTQTIFTVGPEEFEDVRKQSCLSTANDYGIQKIILSEAEEQTLEFPGPLAGAAQDDGIVIVKSDVPIYMRVLKYLVGTYGSPKVADSQTTLTVVVKTTDLTQFGQFAYDDVRIHVETFAGSYLTKTPDSYNPTTRTFTWTGAIPVYTGNYYVTCLQKYYGGSCVVLTGGIGEIDFYAIHEDDQHIFVANCGLNSNA